jgi:hypothetical protein
VIRNQSGHRDVPKAEIGYNGEDVRIPILRRGVMAGKIPAFAVLLIAVVDCAHAQEPRLPAKVSLVDEFEKFDLPAHRQGDRDTCSLFAVTAMANFECDRREPNARVRLSEEFLIWAANDATGMTGDQAMFYEALVGLNRLGICSDSLMPYQAKSDPQRAPSRQALAQARELSGRWRGQWIKRWDLKNPLTDHQLREIKQALVAGHPVACGLRWPKSLSVHELLEVPNPSEVRDGHSILFVGFADNRRRPGGGSFVFRNSDGPAWGENGYGEMSYAYARAYANDAVWLHFGPPHSEVPAHRYEAESLPIAARERCPTSVQSMDEWGGRMWSGDRQLFCQADAGGFVELAFEVREARRHRLRVLATAAPDYGVVRVTFTGPARGEEFDLYSGRICPSGSLELGTFDLAAGRHMLRFTAVRKNKSSPNHWFGIDAVDLMPPRS